MKMPHKVAIVVIGAP